LFSARILAGLFRFFDGFKLFAFGSFGYCRGVQDADLKISIPSACARIR
jgi:hypothetical protein